MAALMPIMELSKKWMDATGCEIMDKVISDIPIFTDMFGKNDMTAIHEMIKNTKKVFGRHHRTYKTSSTENAHQMLW